MLLPILFVIALMLLLVWGILVSVLVRRRREADFSVAPKRPRTTFVPLDKR